MKKLIYAIFSILIVSTLVWAASTTTTNYSLTKPGVGDTDWGTSVNTNFDTIDSQMKTNADAIAAGGAAVTLSFATTVSEASLSNETVIGGTPQGELGGTWASPTIDDSVSVTSWDLTTPTITTSLTTDSKTISEAEIGRLDGLTSAIIDNDKIDTFSELQAIVADETLLKAGTLTDTKFCIYDSGNTDIVCNSEGGSGVSLGDDNAWTGTNSFSTTLTIGAYTMPLVDSTDGYVLTTTGNGTAQWEASAGGAETNSLETLTTGIATTEIPIGTAANTVVYAPLSGDVTMANDGAVTIGNDKIDSQHYVAGSIDLEHMSSQSVDSDNIVTGTIAVGDMAANSIDSAQYVDGSIDLAHMSSQSVDSDNIVDATIAIGDLANGTDGQLITWAADATAAVVATGTADQVLTSNGAGAAPTFQDASGGITASDDVAWTGTHTFADTVTFNGVTTVSTTLTVDRIDGTAGITTIENTLYVDSNGASGITFPTVDADPCTTLGNGGLFLSNTTSYETAFCCCINGGDYIFNTTESCDYAP